MATLSKLADYLSTEYDKPDLPVQHDEKVSVNPVVAEVASWYEKLRNVMDYREDEVILRAAIERILKRRLLLGGNGATVALPLVRELVWARYFPDSSVPQALVDQVSHYINLYLALHKRITTEYKQKDSTAYEWTIHLLSSEIKYILSPGKEKELISNFMYQILKEKVSIADDSEETKDVQEYIAVRRAFSKEDIALLRYHLFIQYFGRLTESSMERTARGFWEGKKIIEDQITNPLQDKVYTYVKKNTAPFIILEDILQKYKFNNKEVLQNTEELEAAVLNACSKRYEDIMGKVQRAVIRSVIFIFITKAVFALLIEGSFERIFYGKIIWTSIFINMLIPPLLMIFAGLFIKTPDKENSERIKEIIASFLYEEKPLLPKPLAFRQKSTYVNPFMQIIFSVLWFLALTIGMATILYVLNFLQINYISQVVFIFFLIIVSFLSYRISQTAHIYNVTEKRQNLTSVLFDFLLLPFIQLGKNLTVGIAQVNIFLIFFDFFIETPFKEMFAFFEQWFLFLRSQRERLE